MESPFNISDHNVSFTRYLQQFERKPRSKFHSKSSTWILSEQLEGEIPFNNIGYLKDKHKRTKSNASNQKNSEDSDSDSDSNTSSHHSSLGYEFTKDEIHELEEEEEQKDEFIDIYVQQNCANCSNVLIVDDDAFNLITLELILKKLSLTSKKAYNGYEAVEAFKSEKITNRCPNNCKGIQLIIMDYQMPIMNGVEATLEICSLIREYHLQPIPIIACSAFEAKDDIERCLNAGMIAYLKKPINVNKLKEIIDQCQNSNLF